MLADVEVTSIEKLAPLWDGIVALQSPDTAGLCIDRWCSTFAWSRSVQRAFASSSGLLAASGENNEAALFARHDLGQREHALVPLDVVWAFGTPVLGISSELAAQRLHRLVESDGARAAFFGGIPEGSTTWTSLISVFSEDHRLLLGEERIRCQASLDGGLDGFLSRRRREFRRNLRQLDKRVADASVRVEVLDRVEAPTVLERLLRIEASSWKGLEGSGMTSPEMTALYELVAHELVAAGALRAAVAVDAEGNDLAFILGGVIGETYRGLQLSFVESARSLSLGNFLQWHEIQRLCTFEPQVSTYDLGMDMAYKRAWSERLHPTRTLIAVHDH
jgi:Acetyltransferase (GNAT) domain